MLVDGRSLYSSHQRSVRFQQGIPLVGIETEAVPQNGPDIHAAKTAMRASDDRRAYLDARSIASFSADKPAASIGGIPLDGVRKLGWYKI